MIGINEVPCPAPCKSGGCFTVRKGDTLYRCAKAFSHATGVKIGTIYQSLSRTGSVETIGNPRGGSKSNTRPVTIGPHHWPSIRAMASDLACNRSTLSKWLKSNPEAVLALVMRWELSKDFSI